MDDEALARIGIGRSTDGTFRSDIGARGWGLFTVSMDCSEAAHALDEAVVEALTENKSIPGTLWPVMCRYGAYGASDSEAVAVLRLIHDAKGGTRAEFQDELGAAMRGDVAADGPVGPGR